MVGAEKNSLMTGYQGLMPPRNGLPEIECCYSFRGISTSFNVESDVEILFESDLDGRRARDMNIIELEV